MSVKADHRQIERQINCLIVFMVENGLADDQSFAFSRDNGNRIEVTFEKSDEVWIALKDIQYEEIYQQLAMEGAYNLRMLDGALIQMMYEFSGRELQRHRLAFYPSPHLDEFQNTPDIYLDDDVNAGVVARSVVPFPVRFDFNAMVEIHQEILHPKTHLTLGQYQHCRIPVSSPLTPHRFVDFILRSFYHTSSDRYAENLPVERLESFCESITDRERGVIHVNVPRT